MIRKHISISSNGKDIRKKKTRGNQWSILWNARKSSENQNIHWKRREQSSETLAPESHRPGNGHIITNQDGIESLPIDIVELCFKFRSIKNGTLQIFIIIFQLIHQTEDFLVCTRLRLLQNIIVTIENDLQLGKSTEETVLLTFGIFYLCFCYLPSAIERRSEHRRVRTPSLDASRIF